MSIIRNYTSKAEIFDSVDRIERTLIEAGARAITKDYDGGAVVGIRFEIKADNEHLFGVRIPAKVDEVFKLFKKDKPGAAGRTLDNLKRQAERTAWALLRDWVDVQMSLIKLKQAKAIEVFLPYLWSGQETFFEVMQKTQFKMLGPGFSPHAALPAAGPGESEGG